MSINKLTEEDILFVRAICRRNFQNNPDLANDCFLYVWEKLQEDDSRRVRAFRAQASFRTYLQTVTGKLVIDFRRSQFGYKVLPKYYWEFDEINRHIFKLFFFNRLTADWIENSIRTEFTMSLAEAQIRVDHVEKRMRESRLQLDEPGEKGTILLGEEVDSIPVNGQGANPEENLITSEAREKKEEVLRLLKEEISRLEDEEALILQLYFEQGLTAREISAAIPGIGHRKIYKKIQRILKNLGDHMRKKGITEQDIRDIFEGLP